MKVSLWAEIRRLHEIERLSKNAIARQLGCCHKTVSKALAMDQPPSQTARPARTSKLDRYKPQIDQRIARYPHLSAVRILEEIAKGEDGYSGGITLVRDYLRTIRPARGRVYQEVLYDPGEAMQVDWGACHRLKIGNTLRRVSVLVAVLCYSRLCYIEFSLAEKKADFYRSIVNALKFFGGSARKIIFDNLKAAVISGSGKYACFHPEFLELCGHFCLQPVACARRDPESKGMVETNVRYVKQNALAGRDDELTCWEDYGKLAEYWRDQGAEVACHTRCFQRQQLICQDEHLLEAKTLRRRQSKSAVEDEFDRLGEAAQTFHLKLLSRPIKPQVHLRRLIKLAQLYGREEVLAAIEQANQYETYDAEYVEAILHQQRRQRELPSPTEVLPVRSEWLDETDYESPDPAHYDRFIENDNDTPNESITEKA